MKQNKLPEVVSQELKINIEIRSAKASVTIMEGEDFLKR